MTWQQTVEEGAWANHAVERIEIPAVLGLQNGVWYRIRRGVQGLLVEIETHIAAYVIVEPASYYFRIMTRSEQMPVLIGEGYKVAMVSLRFSLTRFLMPFNESPFSP